MSSILIYGSPGSGKTYLASTMTKLGYKVLFLDMDKKINKMEILRESIENGNIKFWQPKAKLLEMDLSKRVKAGPKGKVTNQPQGYVEFVEKVTELQNEPKNFIGDDKPENYVIVVDSITRVIEHMKRLILQIQGRSSMQFEDWGFVLSNLEEFLDCFYGLQDVGFKHCIINAHDKLDKDETTGKTTIKPLIDGAMKDKIGAYVEEMYYCFIDIDVKNNANYKCITKPVRQISQARTSRDLNTITDSNFESIFYNEKKDLKNE